jgi:hypothetical protein
MALRLSVLGLLALLFPVTGCSTYRSGFDFQPRPLESAILPREGKGSARALVSVVGIRRRDKDAGRPEEVEVRLLLENRTDADIILELGSLLLVSGNLRPFDDPRIEGRGEGRIAPAASESYRLFFPVPPPDDEGRQPDLDGLNLRLTVGFRGGEERVTVGATFSRIVYRDDASYDHWFDSWRVGTRWTYCY